ncbi:phosphate ABC transporter substrate-binding protein PstS [Galbitalea soli]|uniref:phosphate ABC transporter substrate-binding protein PstS n=1 Tax=Galbitalea soli TaxID=1268042 RepID=UPI0018161010|nr:phosphate transport system substrate-binding protein [Galbitalea soli]
MLSAASLALPAAPAAAAVGTEYYPISGVGSTWSANALQQWIRNVWNNYRWKVVYNDAGSSAGRQLFGQQGGGYDFAVSEIPYQLKNSDSVDPRPARKFAYMPIVAGGTSFMYNLVIAGKRVTNLRLSGQNVAKIFTGVITRWNDPAIAADNPKLSLPAIPIIPVVRSDGSGTSAQFSTWMRSQYPSIWSAFCVKANRGANCGITSNYPTPPSSNFIAQSGSNGVAGYVAQPQYVGAIAYVEYSYALNARFPVVKLLNKAGYYTEPTAPNVAVALLGAKINQNAASPDYLTQDLTGVYTNADPRTYPLSSYSYMIIPTALEYGFTENKGKTLAAFANYFLCEGQQQAQVLGYSPLPINLAQAGLQQVLKIPGGDPSAVDIKKCNNPTFSADGTNKLAKTAPMPQACDKEGATQCLTGTGGAANVATSSNSGGSTAGAVSSGSGGGGGGVSAGGTSSLGAGQNGAVGSDGSAAASNGALLPATVAGVPQMLPVAATPAWLSSLEIAVVAAIALGLIFLPPALSHRPARGVSPPRAKPARRRTPRAPRTRALPVLSNGQSAEADGA